MIDLSHINISEYNHIIETRNKVYRLAMDLSFRMSTVLRLSTIVSEVLTKLIKERDAISVKFCFTKKYDHYFLHVLIASNAAEYQRFKLMNIFRGIKFSTMNENESFMDLELRIMDQSFVPNDAFLQDERERLIQQSSSEMSHEIRRQNKELNKALEDLKTSSKTIQVEKMRALGDMTAGVAHELNNPMMGILNYIQYAIKHTDEEARYYRPLVDAEREVQRCQDIITNLLTFSRMKAEGEEDFDTEKVSELCKRIVKLHAYKLRNFNVNVVEKYPDNEPSLPLKVNKLQQVILNFVTNAIFAMKEQEKRDLTLEIIIGTSSVTLKITDTGTGMDEETLDKIFEPFFTTKKTGEGTGLGLSVSKSIIEEHQGTLTCTSELGVGTSFSVNLPLKRNGKQ